MKLLFVTGLQKSGTSLLNRLLMSQPTITNPFLPEGKAFWGDDPPFNPELSPCGTIFQSHQGTHGHHISIEDYTSSDQTLLQSRIDAAKVRTPVLLNKNPYLSVRLPWVKKVFPDSVIICIFRKPEANIFSLLKKYHLNEPNQTEDWWGVKPLNWQSLVNENKLKQTVKQWNAVNNQLLADIDCIDFLLEYSSLCNNPLASIQNILKCANTPNHEMVLPDHKLTCMDNEYLTGGTLESKNKQLRQTNGFQLKSTDRNDFSKLDHLQIQYIKKHTSETYSSLINQSL